MEQVRRDYGSVELDMVAKELGERWSDLEDKDRSKFQKMAAKRKETFQAKMDNYQAATDPLGYLKKQYDHLIPKRPMTPYFLFLSDEAQRKKALQAGGTDETRMTKKLSELWKALTPESKATYEYQFEKLKVEYEQKLKAWQQTKQFKEIDALERQQREKEKAEKLAQKESEEAEIRDLLKNGLQPGLGLEPGRPAVITGLTSQAQLNGKEVELVEYLEASERWVVMPMGSAGGDPMNIRPANLTYKKLIAESEKLEKRKQQEAVKKQAAAEERELVNAKLREIKEEHRLAMESAKEEQRKMAEEAKAVDRAMKQAMKDAANQAEKAVQEKFKAAPAQPAPALTAAQLDEAECLD